MKRLRMSVKSDSKCAIVIKNNGLKDIAKELHRVIDTKLKRRYYVITDRNVKNAGYADVLIKSLKKQSISTELITLNPGEKTKSFDVYRKTTEKILSKGFSRNDILIALGGGVIGDLTGFIASSLLRGVNYIQVPTTLLSMVDSSVGGKTAINSAVGKNLIGSFKQPSLVLIDPLILNTLPSREIRAGYVEMYKMALGLNKHFFLWLEKNGRAVCKLDNSILEKAIYNACNTKRKIVLKDEKETKEHRALLNLGHTFGHVYENISKYDVKVINHGESVGIGIVNSLVLSEKLGVLKSIDLLGRVQNHFDSIGIKYNTAGFCLDKKIKKSDIISIIKKDKKAEIDSIKFVVVTDIGKSKTINIDLSKENIKLINSIFG